MYIHYTVFCAVHAFLLSMTRNNKSLSTETKQKARCEDWYLLYHIWITNRHSWRCRWVPVCVSAYKHSSHPPQGRTLGATEEFFLHAWITRDDLIHYWNWEEERQETREWPVLCLTYVLLHLEPTGRYLPWLFVLSVLARAEKGLRSHIRPLSLFKSLHFRSSLLFLSFSWPKSNEYRRPAAATASPAFFPRRLNVCFFRTARNPSRLFFTGPRHYSTIRFYRWYSNTFSGWNVKKKGNLSLVQGCSFLFHHNNVWRPNNLMRNLACCDAERVC